MKAYWNLFFGSVPEEIPVEPRLKKSRDLWSKNDADI